jgi:uncharacterized membrane protein YfcA
LISLLTFFSGFGLGTLLMPVFAIWFPVDLAIALTSLVHVLNNLFKLSLVGRNADRAIVLRFSIPAVFTALLGAWILVRLAKLPPLAEYTLGGHSFQILPVKLLIAFLIIIFALFDIIPRFRELQIPPRYLPIGGLLSGFFGGLSGHQGALRSAFLIRSDLSKESFIATGVVIACLVDLARLGVYLKHFLHAGLSENKRIVIFATLAAFLGAYLGNHFLKKVTFKTVHALVTLGLFLIALALGGGVI